MKYSAYRSSIKDGDIIALSHYKWASWYDIQVQAVRVFTQSEYSHVGIAWWANGRLFIIESVTPVVRIVPVSTLAEEGFYHVPLGVETSDAEIDFALSKVGIAEYSKIEAILSRLNKITIGVNSRWSCAEFTIACRSLSGVDLGSLATPSAVVRAAQNLGSPVYFVSSDGMKK